MKTICQMLRKADFDLLHNVLSHSFLPPCLTLFFSAKRQSLSKVSFKEKKNQQKTCIKTQEKKKTNKTKHETTTTTNIS